MATKYLNLSTDSTFSENSDYLIPSQKAIKTAVDAKQNKITTGEGLSLSEDGQLINTVLDKTVLASNYVNPTLWKGTLAEYEALGTYDDNITYIITDDTDLEDMINDDLISKSSTYSSSKINELLSNSNGSANVKSGIQLNAVTKHLLLTGDATTFDSNTHQDAVPTIKYIKELVPTKTSQLTNDSNYLTSHQDISGKANTSLNNLTSAGNTYLDNRIANAITNQLNIQLDAVYPVGSLYFCTQSTCPMTALIKGSTWEKVGSSLITDISSSKVVTNNQQIKMKNDEGEYGLIGREVTTFCIGGHTFQSGGSAVKFGSETGLTVNVDKTLLTVNIFKRTA